MESLSMKYQDQHAITEGWKTLVKISISIISKIAKKT